MSDLTFYIACGIPLYFLIGIGVAKLFADSINDDAPASLVVLLWPVIAIIIGFLP